MSLIYCRCRYCELLDAVAKYVMTENVPISQVESPGFRTLMVKCDPKYPEFSRYLVQKAADQLSAALRLRTQQLIDGAHAICLTAGRKLKTTVYCSFFINTGITNNQTYAFPDIWSKRGLSESFLGITAHFFDPVNCRIRNIVLACRRFSIPHTGEAVYNLVKEIASEWKIPRGKVLVVVTDNGSNMVKALKFYLEDLDDLKNFDGCAETVDECYCTLKLFVTGGDNGPESDEEITREMVEYD